MKKSELEKLVGKLVCFRRNFWGGTYRPKRKDVRDIGKIVDVKVGKSQYDYDQVKVLFPMSGETEWVCFTKKILISENGPIAKMLRDPEALRKALKSQRKAADRQREEIKDAKRKLKEMEKYHTEINRGCDMIEEYLTEVVS